MLACIVNVFVVGMYRCTLWFAQLHSALHETLGSGFRITFAIELIIFIILALAASHAHQSDISFQNLMTPHGISTNHRECATLTLWCIAHIPRQHTDTYIAANTFTTYGTLGMDLKFEQRRGKWF